MKNFWKSNCKLAFLGITLIIANTIFCREVQKMPSVAEVFGGLSEEQIAEQVQMGQKFLEDLEKNGTPEERAEFEKLLVETLNSMSDEDKQDIMAISEMVEPHLNIPAQPTQVSAPETKSETKTETKSFETSDVEEFKKLISTIIQRIDDIFQKLNSSKECTEEVDVKWSGKITFNNMKRQIAQLKTDRLAQKLAKRDSSGDDKDLVDLLKKFLKDLSQENDDLIIEDDFGLPASYATEKKHLKKAKSILSMFDTYIDKLMPMLEKFLRKWDHEALQMAKESDEKTKKATKDATDATKRSASEPARPATSTAGGQKYPGATGAGYPDYGQYPEYYDQANYPGGAGAGMPGSETGKPTESGAAAKAKDTTSTQVNKDKAKEQTTNNAYRSVISDLEGHIADDFNADHEEKFIKFMKNVGLPVADVSSGAPDYPVPFWGSTPPRVQPYTDTESTNWLTTDFDKYKKGVDAKFKSFAKELQPLRDTLEDTKHALTEMTAGELDKIQSSSALSNIERRVKSYIDAFSTTQKALDTAQTATLPLIGAAVKNDYTKDHTAFTTSLQSIGNEFDTAMGLINSIKRSAKRVAKNKKAEAQEQKATPQTQKAI